MKNSQSQETIFNLLFNEDEITWQSIIYDLIAKENMDPWDINVSLLSEKFLQMLRKLKDMDFRISGKMVLAAAILLKIKSNKFIDEDIAALDQMIAEPQDVDLLEGYDDLPMEGIDKSDLPKLYPRTPQPRKRKVSVYDLVNALEKALEVENRRRPVMVTQPAMVIPEKSIDINTVIKSVYGKVQSYFAKKTTTKLTFDQICQSDRPMDKVMTFIPLLHLDSQRKVDLLQEEHFGEIEIQIVRAG
jgi:segregation and condensation protein A